MNQPTEKASSQDVARAIRHLHLLADKPAPGPGHTAQECEVCQSLAVACVDYALSFVHKLAKDRPLLAMLLGEALEQEFRS